LLEVIEVRPLVVGACALQTRQLWRVSKTAATKRKPLDQ